MQIASLSLENFRCFGPKARKITFKDVTALLGSNGAGKSAVLVALARMFGVSSSERTIEREDFHLPSGEEWDSKSERHLTLEVVLRFPELADKEGQAAGPAACFKHMTLADVGDAPYCRVRLSAVWSKSASLEGDIDQKLDWVRSPIGTPAGEEDTSPMNSHERSGVQVHYVPASRDPARQIRQVSGSLLHRLLTSVDWSSELRETVENSADSIRAAFGEEAGVGVIEEALRQSWSALHAAPEHKSVAIRPVARDLAEIVRQVEAAFGPGPSSPEDGLERLSDGQRSRLYLSIVSTLLAVQARVAAGEVADKGIRAEQLVAPALSVLAIEEPENHVAPHYLGRIMEVLRSVAEAESGQVIATSHSPAIVSRVRPEEIRHLRRPQGRGTIVRKIKLPKPGSEHHQFVRGAVLAYPELYFARMVVLGEGASEEIVLPRIAEVLGVPVDRSFVSVVPLGGRHVSHFWRLLDGLGIPYVTLLDLDRERPGGGFGRIKYAVQQLLELDREREELLTVEEDGEEHVLTDDEIAEMHTWGDEGVDDWLKPLEELGVYYSAPLDLDFLMQRAFADAYELPVDEGVGPSIPSEETARAKANRKVIAAVLKGGATTVEYYDDDDVDAFFWYRYLFLGRSKPATHIEAMSRLSDEDLSGGVPDVLQRLVKAVKVQLADELGEDGGGA